MIEFQNDVVCQFTAAYTAGGRLERYELHGDYVSVYLEGVNKGWILRGGERTELNVPAAGTDTIAQARHFVQSVINDVDFPPPAATLQSSIDTLRLCENILYTLMILKTLTRCINDYCRALQVHLYVAVRPSNG